MARRNAAGRSGTSKVSSRGDAQASNPSGAQWRTETLERVLHQFEIPGSRWRAPRNDKDDSFVKKAPVETGALIRDGREGDYF
jgi:hypothetical protein